MIIKTFEMADLRDWIQIFNTFRRILLAARAEAAKSPTVIFLYQDETLQTTMLPLSTVQEFFFD